MAKAHSNVIKEIEKQINVTRCWFDDDEGLFHCIKEDNTEWTSHTGSLQEEWIRIPKATCPPNTRNNVENPVAPTEVDWKKLRQLEVDSPTQTSIRIITNAMQDLLLYKNKKYGDSAINPLGVFTKHIKHVEANTASILVRLDDKLSRVKNADELRVNDVADIMGYCTLLLISMGVSAEDIAKFKD